MSSKQPKFGGFTVSLIDSSRAASSSLLSPMESPSPIPRESFATAVDALLKWIKTQPKHQKSQLFEPDDVLYLNLTLVRIPSKGRTNPFRIPVPHPIHPFDPESTSICLILDDRTTSPLTPSAALDQIRTRSLPIAHVIGLSDLKSDYRPYESRRKLCDSYDLFFADRKILPLLPRLLGKHFFKRKKIPLAVDPSRVGWAEQIKSWCESSLLYLRTGTCAGLKIGRVTQSRDDIVENAMAVIEGAMELVPKKWGNLRSVHVKTAESLALPVYQKVPEIGMKIEGVLDEKDSSLVKRKKRGREGKEDKKGKKKEKKGRIHDAGALDGNGDDAVFEEEDEVMVSGDDGVVNDDVLDGDGEEAANAKLNEKGIKKKKGKGAKATVVIREEEDGVVNDGNNHDDDLNEDDEGENAEVEEKETKKKKRKKGGKTKKGKGGADEEDSEEKNVDGELSGKRTKKMKKMEVAIVAANEVKSSKPKKKRDHNMSLNDDAQEEENVDLGKKKVIKTKKVKNNEKKDGGKGGVGEENGGDEFSEKRAKKKKVTSIASDGIKKSKSKNKKTKI